MNTYLWVSEQTEVRQVEQRLQAVMAWESSSAPDQKPVAEKAKYFILSHSGR